MKRPVMLDLFSGLGGAHAAMADRGWTVISVEIEERFKPTIVADISQLPLVPFPVDLLWASPPCTFYTRKYLETHGRLYRDEPDPDLMLWRISEEIIRRFLPTWWVIENVQGAIAYHGRPNHRYMSRCLWTNIPLLPQLPYIRLYGKHRYQNPWRSQLKSKIPYPISEAVASAVEAFTAA